MNEIIINVIFCATGAAVAATIYTTHYAKTRSTGVWFKFYGWFCLMFAVAAVLQNVGQF